MPSSGLDQHLQSHEVELECHLSTGTPYAKRWAFANSKTGYYRSMMVCVASYDEIFPDCQSCALSGTVLLASVGELHNLCPSMATIRRWLLGFTSIFTILVSNPWLPLHMATLNISSLLILVPSQTTCWWLALHGVAHVLLAIYPELSAVLRSPTCP